MGRELRLRLRYDLAELALSMPAIDRFLGENGIADDTSFAVRLAVEEIVSNSIRHGPPGRADAAIDLGLVVEDSSVALVVEDDGIPFDPTTAPERAVPTRLEDWPVGGLGLTLVRRLVHGWRYARSNGRNRLEVLVRRDSVSS